MDDCVSLPNAAELVDELREAASLDDSVRLDYEYVEEIADAIDALLAENAKLKAELNILRMRGEIGCENCAYLEVSAEEYPCSGCSYYSHDKWEWRGVKEE